jgi:nucleoside-diphosphate-sugar epimerase
MNILVTGATGFIGRHLVDALLKNGDNISIVVRQTSNTSEFSSNIDVYYYENSIASMDAIIKSSKPDVVIHLASQFISQHKPEDVISLVKSNIEFGSILLEAMSINNCTRLINTGTSWQHYNDELYNPVNLYAATKQAFDDICKYYIEAKNFSIIHFHLFDSFGENDNRKKLFSYIEECYMRDKFIELSEGNQEIIFIHINTIVKNYLKAIELIINSTVNIKGEIYSIGDKSNILTLRKLLDQVNEKLSIKMKISWGKRKHRVREVIKVWKSFDTLNVLDENRVEVDLFNYLEKIKNN